MQQSCAFCDIVAPASRGAKWITARPQTCMAGVLKKFWLSSRCIEGYSWYKWPIAVSSFAWASVLPLASTCRSSCTSFSRLILIQRGKMTAYEPPASRTCFGLTHWESATAYSYAEAKALKEGTSGHHPRPPNTAATAENRLGTRALQQQTTTNAAPCTQSLQQHAVAARRHRRKRTGRLLHGKIPPKRQQRRASHNTR